MICVTEEVKGQVCIVRLLQEKLLLEGGVVSGNVKSGPSSLEGKCPNEMLKGGGEGNGWCGISF